MAKCRVVYLPMGTPPQVYTQAIRAYLQDNLPLHPPQQVGAEIARANKVPQKRKLPSTIAIEFDLVIFRNVKSDLQCAKAWRKKPSTAVTLEGPDRRQPGSIYIVSDIGIHNSRVTADTGWGVAIVVVK